MTGFRKKRKLFLFRRYAICFRQNGPDGSGAWPVPEIRSGARGAVRLFRRLRRTELPGFFLDHFFIFQKNSLHLKMANFSSLKRRSIFTSRKILREKLELHSTSKKSLNIAKMVEKRFELPTSTHDLSYEKIRLADCHKIPIFSDKSENPHARVTGVHKFLTFTPPSVPVDNREASHQEMKPL